MKFLKRIFKNVLMPLCIVATLLYGIGLWMMGYYPFCEYFADTSVEAIHGIKLPASARNIKVTNKPECGCPQISHPMDDHAEAEFIIDKNELQPFLKQFEDSNFIYFQHRLNRTVYEDIKPIHLEYFVEEDSTLWFQYKNLDTHADVWIIIDSLKSDKLLVNVNSDWN